VDKSTVKRRSTSPSIRRKRTSPSPGLPAPQGHYSEADARSIFLQIIRAIQYLHSKWAPCSKRAALPSLSPHHLLVLPRQSQPLAPAIPAPRLATAARGVPACPPPGTSCIAT
jgi:hypothetical protein